MRLRLSIQRHELPVVKILWHVPSDSSTISKLLEQISDVVPLESDGWGCEDYAVRVNGYECLHYLDVHKILNEDDEVSIRALETSDIRARIISGRHQISAAGAHLIDGIPFGRNYLKRPDRPSIHIPPRKRQRVSYDDNNLRNSSGLSEQQLRITSTFDDADVEEDVEEELQAIEEASRHANDVLPATGRLRSGKRRKSVSFDESSLSSSGPQFDIHEDSGVEQVREDQGSTSCDSTNESSEDEGNARSTPGMVRPAIKTSLVKTSAKNSIVCNDSDGDGSDSGKSDTNQCNSKLLFEEGSDTDDSTGSTRSPSISSSFSSVSSDQSNGSSQHDIQNDSTETGSSSSSDTNSTSESSSSNAEDENSNIHAVNSDNGTGTPMSIVKTLAPHQNDQSKPHSFKDRSDSVITASEPQHTQVSKDNMAQPSKILGVQRTAPGMGKITTRARNQRRNLMKKVRKLQERGLADSNSPLWVSTGAPARSTTESLKSKFHEKQQLLLDALAKERFTVEPDLGQKAYPPNAIGPSLAEIKADTLIAGQPDPSNSQLENPSQGTRVVECLDHKDSLEDMPEEESSRATDIKVEINIPTASKPLRKTILDFLKSGSDEDKISDTALQDLEGSDTGRQRSKINLDGSRRLLFGSLGVRTPKTKEEEEKVRLQLSKEAERKPGKGNMDGVTSELERDAGFNAEALQPDEDPEAWRSKIKLSAVECCDPEIRYSTPPFPFVQRWDPQQRIDPPTRNKKRKRKNRHYPNDQDQTFGEYPELIYNGERNTETHGESNMEYDDSFDQSNVVLVNANAGATSQLLQDIVDSSMNAANSNVEVAQTSGENSDRYDGENDLPVIPSHVETLPVFGFSSARPEMVIAFKELECSEATCYQPIVSAYRTAIINSVVQEDQQLMVTLAKRDRLQPAEPRYDDSGRRIVGRFEVHIDETSDEEDAGSDDGQREFYFTDLIDPKILRSTVGSMQSHTSNSSSFVENGEDEGNSSGSHSSRTLMVHDSMIVGPANESVVDGVEHEVDSEGQQDSMFTNENISANMEIGTEG